MNFFDAHSLDWIILVGLATFPRITLLFVGGPFGLLSWVGWLFAPHLLVAILATSAYWTTNPVVCVIAWFIALAGTGGEARAVRWGSRKRTQRRDT